MSYGSGSLFQRGKKKIWPAPPLTFFIVPGEDEREEEGMMFSPEQQKILDALEKLRRSILRPDFCYACNGSGAIRKPIEEWSEAEVEYNACPRINGPSKLCPDCNGTGSIEL